jgi:N-acetylglucosaminyl-diphospho-decaprenol L-rhamnosyltransferase
MVKEATLSGWKRLPRALYKVAVVIVSYNTVELTRQCIDAALDSTGVELEIFVIDNASTDRSPTHLARRYHLKKDQELQQKIDNVARDSSLEVLYPSLSHDAQQILSVRSGKSDSHTIHILESRENLGFGRANNLAMSLTDAEYILFLNSDAFLKPSSVYRMVRAWKTSRSAQSSSVLSRTKARIENLGIVGAHLYNQDQTPQVQGGALPTLSNIFSWITFLDDFPFFHQISASYQHHASQMSGLSRQKWVKVGWVGGTVMMLSRNCLQEIGGFDPRIFMYGEDVELCWRATKRHWDVALVDAGKVIHLGSASSDNKRAMVGEIGGLIYLWKKHCSKSELWLLRQILKFGIRLRILVFGILRRYGRQRIYKEALALV